MEGQLQLAAPVQLHAVPGALSSSRSPAYPFGDAPDLARQPRRVEADPQAELVAAAVGRVHEWLRIGWFAAAGTAARTRGSRRRRALGAAASPEPEPACRHPLAAGDRGAVQDLDGEVVRARPRRPVPRTLVISASTASRPSLSATITRCSIASGAGWSRRSRARNSRTLPVVAGVLGRPAARAVPAPSGRPVRPASRARSAIAARPRSTRRRAVAHVPLQPLGSHCTRSARKGVAPPDERESGRAASEICGEESASAPRVFVNLRDDPGRVAVRFRREFGGSARPDRGCGGWSPCDPCVTP